MEVVGLALNRHRKESHPVFQLDEVDGICGRIAVPARCSALIDGHDPLADDVLCFHTNRIRLEQSRFLFPRRTQEQRGQAGQLRGNARALRCLEGFFFIFKGCHKLRG